MKRTYTPPRMDKDEALLQIQISLEAAYKVAKDDYVPISWGKGDFVSMFNWATREYLIKNEILLVHPSKKFSYRWHPDKSKPTEAMANKIYDYYYNEWSKRKNEAKKKAGKERQEFREAAFEALSFLTDKELVAELRNRGLEVTARRVTVEEL